MNDGLKNGAPAGSRGKRRQVFRLLGAAAAGSLAGGLLARTAAAQAPGKPAAAPATPSCTVRPQQTEGPFFVDQTLRRSDIRSDPTDGSLRPGIPLELEFRVSRISSGNCAPLAGAVVDVWQCDAQGAYSAVPDLGGMFDTRGRKFLRGHQVTDGRGSASFLTIYPGWYPGRTVHIHFKIRTDPGQPHGFDFTSQLYFDDAVTDEVSARHPYAARGPRTIRNESDGIFRRGGGSRLIVPLVKTAQGYAGVFDIGLELN
jgi:protocatechuate 3,4-dioxygenase beta subunit